ncbi:hypothetical protein N2152v2_009316 [Parachlorella kessleri]
MDDDGQQQVQQQEAAGGGGAQLKGYSLELPVHGSQTLSKPAAPILNGQSNGAHARESLRGQRQPQRQPQQPLLGGREAGFSRPPLKRPRLSPPLDSVHQNGQANGRPANQQRQHTARAQEAPRQQDRSGKQDGFNSSRAEARPAQRHAGRQNGMAAGSGGVAAGSRGARPRPSGIDLSSVDDGNSKRVGRLRLLSRQAGGREPTPDLDDIPGGGSDDEAADVMAAVMAVVNRDKQVQRELAASHATRFGGDSSDDDIAPDLQRAGAVSRSRAAEGRGAKGSSAAAGTDTQHRVAASGPSSNPFPLAGEGSDSEAGDMDGPGGVVEFGGGDYGAGAGDGSAGKRKTKAERRRAATQGAAAVAAGSRPRINIKPGELVHGGEAPGGQAAPAAAGDLFGLDAGSFQGLGLSQTLSDHLASLSFARPTRVQQQTIPHLLKGRDALVHAATGSGKTLSYLAPIVDSLAHREPRIQRGDGTHALVVTPTRELCQQAREVALLVADVLTLLVRRFVWLVGGSIHGGENRGKEKARLRKGVTVLVATPGRLLDHLQNTHSFRTEGLSWLVLDEADRLLDMGFEKKIAEIVGLLDERCKAADYSQRRQTALLSATLHSNLGSLASLSLREDAAAIGFSYHMEDGKMVIASQVPGAHNGAHAPGAIAQQAGAGAERYEIPKQLQQRFIEVPAKLRLVVLAAALRARVAAAPSSAKVVVFFSNCDSVEFYHAVLADVWDGATGEPLLPAKVPVLKLHGNLTQAERTEAFLRFSRCPAGVLLCTDVAARGLDFPAVTTILQFDPPGEAAEYVHRVGRTARLGQRGDALLCLLPSERPYVDHLRHHGVVLQQQPLASVLSKLATRADAKAVGPCAAGGKGDMERHQGAYLLQKQLMDAVAADKRLMHLGEDAFRSYVRAYATHSTELKPIFHIKSLHLGHVAHSFALRERPSLVGKSSSKTALKKRKAEAAKAKGHRERRQGARTQAAAQAPGDAVAGYHLD